MTQFFCAKIHTRIRTKKSWLLGVQGGGSSKWRVMAHWLSTCRFTLQTIRAPMYQNIGMAVWAAAHTTGYFDQPIDLPWKR